MNLRPYHNPESVDESRVPDGWRFLYEDETHFRPFPCMMWTPWEERFGPEIDLPSYFGIELCITYIVPVKS